MAEATINPGMTLDRPTAAGGAHKAGVEKPAPGAIARIEQHNHWPLLAKMPLKLEVGVEVPGFKVRDLLALRPGKVIASAWQSSEDVPLMVGGAQLAWAEFEVVEQRLAIRLTRLA